MVTISISPVAAQSLYIRNARNVPFIPLRNAPFRATTKLSTLAHSSGSISFSPLRFSIKDKEIKKKKKSRGSSAVCYAAPLSRLNLQWISAISSAGEYGIWAAFLGLLVRLFFFIPGELELPFLALLLVIVAPHHVMNLRGTQQGAIISLVIAAYLAYQHFSGAGSLQRAFDQGSIIATVGIVCITVVSCLLLI
ncbi:cold-regulated 413 inner membrane protein 2, chloroplastic isoform X2 [Gossypium raimondii]|uniref:Uncharacterized protein n=1 Tax=Gossypium raimondii TaxID=29730 RepID=A0A0D2SU96_GOSRA|nr:cold-regulated 413 inner membrane protein 2, chloroplastic isoform X2 [Gossypium raimondii]KJB34880.1 hypothetical protein B456_006G094000 [Gossypium raimondii]MBA0587505.1 hypothetical protein [Gossypium raimondii]